MSDAPAASIRWQLRYVNLTTEEWQSLQQLFTAAEGRLNSFTFLDPTDNLLMWSEDWTKPVWVSDPLLQLSQGLTDPLGGSAGIQITNTAQTTQRVWQDIAAPTWFRYTYSIYLRAESPCIAQMLTHSSSQELRVAVAVTSTWTRVSASPTLTTQGASIGFGLELPAGIRIEAFGPQVEAQPSAGQYKKITGRAGVYMSSRFDSDVLSAAKEATNQFSCVVDLVSRLT